MARQKQKKQRATVASSSASSASAATAAAAQSRANWLEETPLNALKMIIHNYHLTNPRLWENPLAPEADDPELMVLYGPGFIVTVKQEHANTLLDGQVVNESLLSVLLVIVEFTARAKYPEILEECVVLSTSTLGHVVSFNRGETSLEDLPGEIKDSFFNKRYVLIPVLYEMGHSGLIIIADLHHAKKAIDELTPPLALNMEAFVDMDGLVITQEEPTYIFSLDPKGSKPKGLVDQFVAFVRALARAQHGGKYVDLKIETRYPWVPRQSRECDSSIFVIYYVNSFLPSPAIYTRILPVRLLSI
ncbi:hypothetical protein BOTBODRAFT_182336 [Botryobasidium botryosum FD-172 SS1]|uniref:Uncharacterized protein n=1 Tax=Botryobasidium botryosum (strain FD-172 SS1) TaxID=930990 RepID=A0A067M1B5_BOTB1|nr:hypothetical protein BOTBODRAFT_182336 [Botryobasidium botryosum FD-172 SS1]